MFLHQYVHVGLGPVFSHNSKYLRQFGQVDSFVFRRQECWSALGAERDGVLRLRHLDRRSDELTGSSVGHGFFSLPLWEMLVDFFGLNFVVIALGSSKDLEVCGRMFKVYSC